MGNYNFNKDLENESKTIDEIVDRLRDSGVEVLELGHTNHGDIKVRFSKSNEVAWVEVKEDFGKNNRGEWTGNIALEFLSRGKPSGLMVGNSRYWIYKIHHKGGIKYLWFKKEDLFSLIENRKHKFIANGGDKGSNTMMFLYSLEVFESVGREIWTS